MAKNSNSISGAMTASSTAATARQSATKAAVDRFARSQIDDIRFIFIALLTDKGEEHRKGFVLERRRSGQEPLAACQIGDVEAEPGDKDRH